MSNPTLHREHAPPASAGTTNLRALGALLWRRRVVMALVLLVVAATVAIGLTVAERQYTAQARVAVTPVPELTSSPANYEFWLSTMADVAESRPLLTEIRDAVGDRTLRELQEQVTSSVVAGTMLVQVSVTDTDPEAAAQIANAVVDLLESYGPSPGAFVFETTEPASVPSRYSSPNIPVTVLAAVVLGVALALAAAVVYDRLVRTVDTAEEAGAATDVRVLGVVARPADTDAVTAADANSSEFESLRALRVALEFATSEQPTRSLVVAPVVTDPWSGWLEVNLAVSLAEVGHRVLLIDANRTDRSRHPVLAANGEPGLYDLLAGAAPLDADPLPGPVDGVSVLPLGNVDLAAPSLLEMRFRRLLEEIDGRYDVILIHAAPVTESGDARIMAIDGALLLTVPAGRVQRNVLERAAAELCAVRTRVLGTVLLGARDGRVRR